MLTTPEHCALFTANVKRHVTREHEKCPQEILRVDTCTSGGENQYPAIVETATQWHITTDSPFVAQQCQVFLLNKIQLLLQPG